MTASPSPSNSFWLRRAFAFAVDVLLTLGLGTGLLTLAGFPVRHIFFRWIGYQTPEKVMATVMVFSATWLVYRGLAESGGRTVGKWLAGLEVEGPHGEPGVARAMVRALTCVPNVLAGAFGKHAPLDALIGVTLRHAPRLRSIGGLTEAWSVPLWVALAAISGTYGLRQTLEEALERFYSDDHYVWCCVTRSQSAWFHKNAEERRAVCEDILRTLIRYEERGEIAAMRVVKSCPRAEALKRESREEAP